MRLAIFLFVCFALHVSLSHPVYPEQAADLPQQETLETLNLGEPGHDSQTLRDKRTIGFLRTLFPGISELIDRQIQNITRYLFRLIGRLVLGGGGGGATSSSSSSSSSSSTGNRRISITLPTYPPSTDDEDENDEDTTAADVNPEENYTGAESQVNEVRVPFVPDQTAEASEEVESDAASESGEREKRTLFGGSGNFLFDIIRLIAGSGSTEESDEAATSGEGVTPTDDLARDDGYTSGIPGPITRLFIIANRGISNLLQDLILRLAQTSERIVNFKARLITSII